jgi:YD repeat-containing protein
LYTYDDARRVTQEDVTGTGLVGTTQVTYAYDALGRPTSATDNNDPNDANSVINAGGQCQAWLDGQTSARLRWRNGVVPVRLLSVWNPRCAVAGLPGIDAPMFTTLDGTIEVCPGVCSLGVAGIDKLLVHELAHTYCPKVFGEDCAIWGQMECQRELEVLPLAD